MAFKTSDQIIKSLTTWKPYPKPNDPPKMSKGLKKERKEKYDNYKKQFNIDKKKVKGLLEGLFKEVSNHNPDTKKRSVAKLIWNYYPSEWDGKWPHLGKLGPKNIRLFGEFWQVKAIIEEFGTDNDYAPVNNLSHPDSNRKGKKGKAKVQIFIDNEYPIEFSSVGEGTFVGDPTDAGQQGVKATTMTTIQELGSALIFKHAIEDDKPFTTIKQIKDDKVVWPELNKIWTKVSGKDSFTPSDEWLNNFIAQNKTLLNKVSSRDWTVFTAGKDTRYTSGWYTAQDADHESFMEWVSREVRETFQIAKKDNWNPADIWLIYKEAEVRKEIKNAMTLPPSAKNKEGLVQANLAQFNAIFRELYKSNKVKGISLKKVDADTAAWKEVNTTDQFFKDMESFVFPFEGAKCSLGIKAGSPNELATQDTMIYLKSGGKSAFEIQIKGTDSRSFDNLKFEPRDLLHPGARMGKATGDYVDDLTKTYCVGGEKWVRKWQDYPIKAAEVQKDPTTDEPILNADGTFKYIPDADSFDEKQQAKYLKIIKHLKLKGVDIGNGVTPEQAIENLAHVFTFPKPRGANVANNKLMQLTWLNYVFTITPKKKFNQFWTDIIFLAEKAGRRYGPYAKLY